MGHNHGGCERNGGRSGPQSAFNADTGPADANGKTTYLHNAAGQADDWATWLEATYGA